MNERPLRRSLTRNGSAWAKFNAFWNEPTNNRPIRRWRIGLGLLAAAFHLSWLASAPLISKDGVIEHAPWGRIASVPIGNNWAVPILVASCGLISASCLVAGRILRVASPLLATSTLSLLAYQPHARNAGDLLIGSWTVLTAIYALCWPTTGWRWRARSVDISPWLRRMLLCQLSIVYLASAAHKLGARDWRDGTAVGFALRYADNLWFGPSAVVLDRPWLNSVLTWGTIALEIGIVVCLWRPNLQRFGALAALALHGGIAVVFDVGLFSPAMLIAITVIPECPRWWVAKRPVATAPG